MIQIKSPTRIDLAGGTLDCWPLYNLISDCVTLNVSIDVFTYADLEALNDQSIEVHVTDLDYSCSVKDLTEFLNNDSPQLSLIKAVINFFKPQKGFRLSTRSESPVGGGLGASSSLCISLIKAFAEFTDQKLDLKTAVTIAHNIEAFVLKKPTGTQDYVPAFDPGLYAIHFSPRGLEPIKMEPLTELADRITLVYTGQPHHSGLNNWQVIKGAVEGNATVLGALKSLRDVSHKTLKVLTQKRFEDLKDCLREELRCRLLLTDSFSSPEILRLDEVALKSGADTIKICGAGGGGCVFIWSKSQLKSQVARACTDEGFKVLDARLLF